MKIALLLLLLTSCGPDLAEPRCMVCVEWNAQGCTWWVAKACPDGGAPGAVLEVSPNQASDLTKLAFR